MAEPPDKIQEWGVSIASHIVIQATQGRAG